MNRHNYLKKKYIQQLNEIHKRPYLYNEPKEVSVSVNHVAKQIKHTVNFESITLYTYGSTVNYKCNNTTLSKLCLNNHDNSCVICYIDFHKNNKIYKCPRCSYGYHYSCIEKITNNLCPYCSHNIELSNNMYYIQ